MTGRADTADMKALALALMVTLIAAPCVVADEAECPEDQRAGVNKLVAPLVAEEGRLAGYAFVTPRMCLARGYSAMDFREREHLLMDAMVRAVHQSPFRLLPDGNIDRGDAETAFRAVLEQVYRPGQVTAIALEGDDIRLIRH